MQLHSSQVAGLRITRESVLVEGTFVRNALNASHLAATTSGTGAGLASAGRSGQLGTLVLVSGTTATGRVGILNDTSSISLSSTGEGFAVEFVYEPFTFSTGTDTFTAPIGFLSTAASAVQNNSVYVDVSTANVVALVFNGSTNTTNTNIATQTVGELYRVRIEVQGGVAKFYHKVEESPVRAVELWPWADSDLKLTVSSGLPNNVTVGMGFGIFKSAGTSSRQLRVQRYLLTNF